MGQAETLPVLTRCLLLATGGDYASLRLAAELGHTIEPPVPSLFTFTISDPRLSELAGISVAPAGLTLLDESGNPPHLPGRAAKWGAVGHPHGTERAGRCCACQPGGRAGLIERGYRARLAINWVYPRDLDMVLGRSPGL